MAPLHLPAQLARMQALRVLTFNVYCGPPTPTHLAGTLDRSPRLAAQVEQIRTLRPDVICLQEVVSDGVRTYFDEQLSDEYQASYVLTSDEIRCKFGRMMRSALDHVGPQTTISGFIYGATQSGLMVLHRRDTLSLDGSPTALTFREQDGDLLNLFRPRGVLCVPLCLNDGSRLVVANTHANAESASMGAFLATLQGTASSLPSVPLKSGHRSRQLHELFKHARKFSDSSRVLICGDLNSAAEHGEIPSLEHGFIDATIPDSSRSTGRAPSSRLLSWDGLKNPLVANGWFSEGHDAQSQLDYIFTSQNSGLVLKESRLVLDQGPPWLSDHFGVMTDFKVGSFQTRQTARARAVFSGRRRKRLAGELIPSRQEAPWGI